MHCTQFPWLMSFEAKCKKKSKSSTAAHMFLTAFISLIFTYVNFYQSFRPVKLLTFCPVKLLKSMLITNHELH